MKSEFFIPAFVFIFVFLLLINCLDGHTPPEAIKVNGKEYEVIKMLGKGKEGRNVYEVRRKGIFYALKENVAKKEIDALQACQGAGIIKYIDSDHIEEGQFGNLVLEMGEKTLAKEIKNGNFEEINLETMKRQLRKGMKTIHNAGFVHYDLDETENVLFFPGPSLKFINFEHAFMSTDEGDYEHDQKLLNNLFGIIERKFQRLKKDVDAGPLANKSRKRRRH